MTEFVGLRAKFCSYLTEDGIEIKKNKGIQKTNQLQMRHRHWKSCLFDGGVVRATEYVSQLKFKILLNAFDDKRFILPDGIDNLPHD